MDIEKISRQLADVVDPVGEKAGAVVAKNRGYFKYVAIAVAVFGGLAVLYTIVT